ncbi:MAG: SDR family oxidoreductase [Acidobacteriaceae bacterium]|nr:SDR family oxidoreductase [Acidobacteriaceae bacterium]
METGLRNRVAVISGASQGLGRATALAFAAEGAHLALCARNADELGHLAADIRARFNVQVHTGAIDVRDSGAIQRFVADVSRIFDSLDVCVTNAGGPPARDFLETTDEEWDDAFRLNLRSAAVFARAVIPHMQRRRWGRIVTLSSITVRQPLPQLVLSNAIRTGILGLVRTLANDFGKYGITVNNVGPGYTATERLKELSARRAAASGLTEQQIEQAWIDQIPLGRLGKSEEVADAVVWLASERASFVTGQTLLVDGGMYRGV